MKMKTLSITEVNSYIKRIFDNDFILNNLSVQGEISNLKYHSSGHIYFSLKDEGSKINCVMFKSDAYKVDFRLSDGLKVVVKCRLSTYVKDGSYQLYIREISESGLGNLHIEFEKLKNRLKEQGLFNEEYKKEIPSFVQTVGVITSQTGAAIRDIVNVINRRNDSVNIVLYPALVQGAAAPNSLIQGIKYLNKYKEMKIDVIIIGRGGGSLEELWGFNDEKLALEIFKSKIPIVSAVGHEVDFTISDFVADVRAATPSAAAEMVTETKENLLGNINYLRSTLDKSIENRINIEKNNIKNIKKIISLNSPINLVINSYNIIDNLKGRLDKGIEFKIHKEKEILLRYHKLLQANNPISSIEKGFAIIQDSKGKIINKESDLVNGVYDILLRDGKFKRRIEKIE